MGRADSKTLGQDGTGDTYAMTSFLHSSVQHWLSMSVLNHDAPQHPSALPHPSRGTMMLQSEDLVEIWTHGGGEEHGKSVVRRATTAGGSSSLLSHEVTQNPE